MQLNPKVITIIQARNSSKRLPGKTLLPILNKPMLLQQIERVKRSTLTNLLVVATSTDPTDDAIAELCKNNNIEYYRGDLEDVLSRFYNCAIKYDADICVRLTGDCPLIDPCYLDIMLANFLSEDKDYFGNTTTGTGWPDGMDIEIFSMQAFKIIHEFSREREHVTKDFYNDNFLYYNIFKIYGPIAKREFTQKKLSVDTKEDYELVKEIFENLYPKNNKFGLIEITNYLEKN